MTTLSLLTSLNKLKSDAAAAVRRQRWQRLEDTTSVIRHMWKEWSQCPVTRLITGNGRHHRRHYRHHRHRHHHRHRPLFHLPIIPGDREGHSTWDRLQFTQQVRNNDKAPRWTPRIRLPNGHRVWTYPNMGPSVLIA